MWGSQSSTSPFWNLRILQDSSLFNKKEQAHVLLIVKRFCTNSISNAKLKDYTAEGSGATHQFKEAQLRNMSDGIQQRKSSPAGVGDLESSMTSMSSQKSSVSFGTTKVWEYDRVFGDLPHVSVGLSVGWRYKQRDPVPVESYEHTKKTMNGPLNEPTSLSERYSILKVFGYSHRQLLAAEATSSKQKQKQPQRLRDKIRSTIGSLFSRRKKTHSPFEV
jgi:hypothetical protein